MTSTAPASAANPFAGSLREAGLRVTAPRLAVLETVAEQPHAEADHIAAAVRERLGSVSTQAVYGVLHALTDAHLLRRVDAGSRSAARYEIERDDNHHHMVCRVCGRLEDVPCQVGHAPCLEPPAEHHQGYDIEVAEVLFRGVCAQCRAQS